MQLERTPELGFERLAICDEAAAPSYGGERPPTPRRLRISFERCKLTCSILTATNPHVCLDQIRSPWDHDWILQPVLGNTAAEKLEVLDREVGLPKTQIEQAKCRVRECDHRPDMRVCESQGFIRVRDAVVLAPLRRLDESETRETEGAGRLLVDLGRDPRRLGGIGVRGSPVSRPEIQLRQTCKRIRQRPEGTPSPRRVDRGGQHLARRPVGFEPGQHLPGWTKQLVGGLTHGGLLCKAPLVPGEERDRLLRSPRQKQGDAVPASRTGRSHSPHALGERVRPFGHHSSLGNLAGHERGPGRVRQHARCPRRVVRFNLGRLLAHQRRSRPRLAVPHLDHTAQMLQARALPRIAGARQRTFEQLQRLPHPSGEAGVTRRLTKSPRSFAGICREGCCPLEGARRLREPTALTRAACSLLERRCNILLITLHGRRQVPGSNADATLARSGARKRLVGLPTNAGWSRVIDSRAKQRVPEVQPSIGDLKKAGLLSGVERERIDTELDQCLTHGVSVADPTRCGDHKGLLSAVGQQRDRLE